MRCLTAIVGKQNAGFEHPSNSRQRGWTFQARATRHMAPILAPGFAQFQPAGRAGRGRGVKPGSPH